jgi:UDP-3-O-[3-hydroxymyristoyl] N-acetylglucosamine deacetylase
MYATRNQRTITASVAVDGVGYWSGSDVRVEFRPAGVDTGVVFVRCDMKDCPRIPATVDYRVEIPRRTVLQNGEASVEMVEHILAALSGLQIDNCEIWVNRPEMPGCDGSSAPFVKALNSVGAIEQDGIRPWRVVQNPIRIGTEESWIEARPCSSGKTILHYELDYGSSNSIGRQSLEISLSPRHFHMNLAPSRTFVLESEAAAMKAQGLGQRATFKDLLVFGSRGLIGNELRFPDECVRHKMVDMVGDLALAGCDLVGRFIAYRSGHRLNAELVRAIAAQSEMHKGLKRCA